MSLILSGSDGLSDVDGSASTPAIRGTDANTGIFFPAADTAAISTGGSERMRIDSSGNLLVGTTASTYNFQTTNAVIYNGTSAGVSLASGTKYLSLAAQSGGAGVYVGARSNDNLIFTTNDTERARITSGGDLQFNSGYGSVATAYGCRAWVNFNGTGTVAIRGSGNVTSITDNGVGQYTVNFTNAFPDANYSTVFAGSDSFYGSVVSIAFDGVYSTTASKVRTANNSANSDVDITYVCLAFFR